MKTVVLIIPNGWSLDKVVNTLNDVSIAKIGAPIFFDTEEEGVAANIKQGMREDYPYKVVNVTFADSDEGSVG